MRFLKLKKRTIPLINSDIGVRLKPVASETPASSYFFFQVAVSSIHCTVMPLLKSSLDYEILCLSLSCNKVAASNCSTWRMIYFKDMYLSQSEASHYWEMNEKSLLIGSREQSKGVSRKVLLMIISSSKQATISKYERNLKKIKSELSFRLN